jgi:DNA-binding CsgD family transcriptional regulator
LRATPWARRAEAELRACGVSGPPAVSDALAGLTTQQREIVTLAAQGLTNAEIGDRLLLSPRTVASHLYRSYPKLGCPGGTSSETWNRCTTEYDSVDPSSIPIAS